MDKVLFKLSMVFLVVFLLSGCSQDEVDLTDNFVGKWGLTKFTLVDFEEVLVMEGDINCTPEFEFFNDGNGLQTTRGIDYQSRECVLVEMKELDWLRLETDVFQFTYLNANGGENWSEHWLISFPNNNTLRLTFPNDERYYYEYTRF